MIIKLCATDALMAASKIAVQKSAEATGDLIGKNIANWITKVSKNSQQNNSKIVTNEHDKKNAYRKIFVSWRKTVNYLRTEINIA